MAPLPPVSFGLPPITSGDDWLAEIAAEALKEFTASIMVILPGFSGRYDPELDAHVGADTGSVALAERPARIQHIRLPLETAGSAEWATRRRYRFQVELRPGDPVITKGMIVVVTDGGRDPNLEAFTYEVISATNSSHAAIRTIETITEMGGASG